MLMVRRPAVHDVSVLLFRRGIHPELFETVAERRIDNDGYAISFRLTPEGHVVAWRMGELCLTEITAARGRSLPSAGRVWRYRFDGEQTDAFRASPTYLYQFAAHAERLTPAHFAMVHDDLEADGRRRGLIFRFPAFLEEWPALGFITADARPGCLVINTFHTFPAERTILKTQSLIERV